MQLAFYGAGAIAERHIDAIRRTNELDITWLVSRTGEHAENLARRKGVARWTTDEQAPLEDPAVGAVVIAYPTFRHADLAARAFAAGKHVVCEKPLASTEAEATAMVVAAEESGRLLLVTQIRRFWPVFAAAHAFVNSGIAGRLVRTSVDFQTQWDWSGRGWRLEEPGGYLLDMHVHDIDLLLWLAGKAPQRIVAIGENRAEREGTVVLDFGDGYARLDWSGRISGRPYPAGARTLYQVACERGRIEIEVGGEVAAQTVVDGQTVAEERTAVGEQIRASWDGMWAAQASALRGRAPIPVPAPEALRNVHVTLAAVESLHHSERPPS